MAISVAPGPESAEQLSVSVLPPALVQSHLRAVEDLPTDFLTIGEQIEEAFNDDLSSAEPGGIVSPKSFVEAVRVGVFVRLVQEKREPEEIKPRNERDFDTINRLHKISDKWLGSIDVDKRIFAISEAYRLG